MRGLNNVSRDTIAGWPMLVASLCMAIFMATRAASGNEPDAEAQAIVRKHCVICHAAKPAHESFQEAPKNVTLETVAEIRKHAAAVYTQTVQTKAMPLGNQTMMTDDERDALGRWLKEQP